MGLYVGPTAHPAQAGVQLYPLQQAGAGAEGAPAVLSGVRGGEAWV